MAIAYNAKLVYVGSQSSRRFIESFVYRYFRFTCVFTSYVFIVDKAKSCGSSGFV